MVNILIYLGGYISCIGEARKVCSREEDTFVSRIIMIMFNFEYTFFDLVCP